VRTSVRVSSVLVVTGLFVVALANVILAQPEDVSYGPDRSAPPGVGNFAVAWESPCGLIWNGYVQIQASFNDNGRHAMQGYHRFIREDGPPLDTGRRWTSVAPNPSCTAIRWRRDSVWDSVRAGPRYVTYYWHGFIWFAQ